jgi:hypothetical protein
MAPLAELATEQRPHAFLVVDHEYDADAGTVGHERLRVRGRATGASATTEGIFA